MKVALGVFILLPSGDTIIRHSNSILIQRQRTNEMKSISCRDGFYLLGLTAIIGLISGVLVAALFVYFDTSNTWQRISNPPEKTAELLDYDYFAGKAYVRTTSGNIYICSSSYNANGRGCEKVVQLSEYPPLNSCDGKVYPIPKLPGTVVSKLEVHPCVEDSWVQVNLIVLDDDSIWKWEKIEGEAIFFGRIFLVGVGAICGVTLSLVSGILLLKRRLQWQAK